MLLRSAAGITGLGLVAAGAWGFFGWPAACLVVGLPVAAFYVVSEWRQMWAGGE